MVLEPNAFHPGRSGRNHLRILADGAGIAACRIDELLEMVGLAHAADRHVGGYSLGMRQRLGIAAALLGDPPVLVLDEPGNGLDPQGIRWLRDLLRERAAAGGTVFVSSHLLAEVEHLADEVVVISHGRLVATGALATLQQAGTSVRTPRARAARPRLLRDAGATVHTGAEGELVVRGLAITDIGDRACAAGIALHELTPQAGSLEELFLDWTSNDNTHHVGRHRRGGRDREAGSTAMTWLRLVRGEIRKLTTTKLPLGFLAVLVLIAGIDAAVVVFGTDMDGSKAFIATAADQQSLMAFAFNAMLGTGAVRRDRRGPGVRTQHRRADLPDLTEAHRALASPS